MAWHREGIAGIDTPAAYSTSSTGFKQPSSAPPVPNGSFFRLNRVVKVGYFELFSEINFRFCSSIQASIRFWRPLSVHSLRAFSSRSISALIIATSPRESMMRVYAPVLQDQLLRNSIRKLCHGGRESNRTQPVFKTTRKPCRSTKEKALRQKPRLLRKREENRRSHANPPAKRKSS